MGYMNGFRPGDGPAWDGTKAASDPEFEHVPALPDREWGLSAMQVLAVVVVIVAVCEVIGLLG